MVGDEMDGMGSVSYTHVRAQETKENGVGRLVLEKKNKQENKTD